MNEREQRRAAAEFVNFWTGKGYEKGQSQAFWLSLLRVLGISHPEQFITFEDKVKLDHTSFIDGFIPSTHVLIEQKGIHRNPNEKIKQSDGTLLTPFQQAKRYSAELPYSQRPRWIVISNFEQIDVYDMENPRGEPQTVRLADLGTEIHRLRFLVDDGTGITQAEKELSLQAGELVGKIYDALLKQYKDPRNPESLRSLNQLCVRIVFCLYAEDAQLFGEHQAFHNYLQRFEARGVRQALKDLFEVLNTPIEERDDYLEEDLAAFPYVAGGLFSDDNIEIPRITDEIRTLILSKASEEFDWSKISPTIFGAVFESTLNPVTRRAGGMHYTSVENIHKVIGPLFLNDLRAELDRILALQVPGVRDKQLKAFQEKLAGLRFLDPACGSGNFLTETYIQLRRLENEALRVLSRGQALLGLDEMDPVKVKINQFYGIEINDFAVTVATAALWIAESQMLHETEDIINRDIDFLPLKSNSNIHESNALRMDWATVIAPSELSYIMGNPPFIGARYMSSEQKDDTLTIFGKDWDNVGNLDYVCNWFKCAADMIAGTSIKAAFVATNSICQGQQVAVLWGPLLKSDLHIDFAWRTFIWDNEAADMAHVHCVIVGFSVTGIGKRVIFDGDQQIEAHNINGYLLDADNVSIASRKRPLGDVPEMGVGNKPIDGGYYLFTEEEKDAFLKLEPEAEPFFKAWYGSVEFINQKPRWCLWLGDATPNELKKLPKCRERVEAVRQFRLSSKSEGTRKIAEKPRRFHVENIPLSTSILVPRVSSERRLYIPMGFMGPESLCSDAVLLVPDANVYHFGVLTSSVHMAWMRAVAGRLEMRYRYSVDIVYNNFPWPEPNEKQKATIEQTAQGILDARKNYPDASFADLYDTALMPDDLRTAHKKNDAAVMKAYGFSSSMSESDIIAALMKLYRIKATQADLAETADAAALKVLGKNTKEIPEWMADLRAQCLAGTLPPEKLIVQGKEMKKKALAAAKK